MFLIQLPSDLKISKKSQLEALAKAAATSQEADKEVVKNESGNYTGGAGSGSGGSGGGGREKEGSFGGSGGEEPPARGPAPLGSGNTLCILQHTVHTPTHANFIFQYILSSSYFNTLYSHLSILSLSQRTIQSSLQTITHSTIYH